MVRGVCGMRVRKPAGGAGQFSDEGMEDAWFSHVLLHRGWKRRHIHCLAVGTWLWYLGLLFQLRHQGGPRVILSLVPAQAVRVVGPCIATGSAGGESVEHGGNLSRADSQNPLHPQKPRVPGRLGVSLASPGPACLEGLGIFLGSVPCSRLCAWRKRAWHPRWLVERRLWHRVRPGQTPRSGVAGVAPPWQWRPLY